MITAGHDGPHYAVCYTVPLPTPIFPSTPFSNALSPFSPLIVRDQVSHPCKPYAKLHCVVSRLSTKNNSNDAKSVERYNINSLQHESWLCVISLDLTLVLTKQTEGSAAVTDCDLAVLCLFPVDCKL